MRTLFGFRHPLVPASGLPGYVVGVAHKHEVIVRIRPHGSRGPVFTLPLPGSAAVGFASEWAKAENYGPAIVDAIKDAAISPGAEPALAA